MCLALVMAACKPIDPVSDLSNEPMDVERDSMDIVPETVDMDSESMHINSRSEGTTIMTWA